MGNKINKGANSNIDGSQNGNAKRKVMLPNDLDCFDMRNNVVSTVLEYYNYIQ